MILNDLIDLVNKEKRKQERMKVVRKLAAGVGTLAIAVLAIKILITRTAKEEEIDMKEKTVNPLETIHDTLHDIKEKAGDVKREIKQGSHEIKKDIHKTAEAIHKKIT